MPHAKEIFPLAISCTRAIGSPALLYTDFAEMSRDETSHIFSPIYSQYNAHCAHDISHCCYATKQR
jgi:hypothetical protein